MPPPPDYTAALNAIAAALLELAMAQQKMADEAERARLDGVRINFELPDGGRQSPPPPMTRQSV